MPDRYERIGFCFLMRRKLLEMLTELGAECHSHAWYANRGAGGAEGATGAAGGSAEGEPSAERKY